jgi:hypothetical protein
MEVIGGKGAYQLLVVKGQNRYVKHFNKSVRIKNEGNSE